MLLHTRIAQAVLPATNADDARYALGAVYIDPDGSVVATDGRVLIRAARGSTADPADYPTQLPDGTACEATASIDGHGLCVEAGTLKTALKAIPRPSRHGSDTLQHVVVTAQSTPETAETATHEQRATVIATDLTSVHRGASVVEGRFPAWQHIYAPARDAERLCSVTLSVPVLERLIKAAKAVGSKAEQKQYMTFHFPAARPKTKQSAAVPTNRQPVYIEVHTEADLPAVDAVAMPMRID